MDIIAISFCIFIFFLFLADHRDMFNLPDSLYRPCRILSWIFLYLFVILFWANLIYEIIWR